MDSGKWIPTIVGIFIVVATIATKFNWSVDLTELIMGVIGVYIIWSAFKPKEK